MANVKLSELTAASAAAAANEFEINESGTSKKVTGTQISTFVRGNIVTADLSDTSVSAAELTYLSGVTSDVQTQLNSKGDLVSTNNLSDLSNAATALTNLGATTATAAADEATALAIALG